MTLDPSSSPLVRSTGESECGQPQRAGLRVAARTNQPTGAFVAVEMAILVIVVALAMVSIIVASVDAGDGGNPGPSGYTDTRTGERAHRSRDLGESIDFRAQPKEPTRTDVATR